METLEMILVLLVTITGIIFLLGVIQPGWAIWWKSAKTRVNVALTWGLIHGVLLVGLFFYYIQKDDRQWKASTPENRAIEDDR